VPRRFAGGASPVTIVDLVFEQRVFLRVAQHVAASPGTALFGCLVGHLFEDPTCERHWARVERTLRCPSVVPEAADAALLGRAWRATEMEWTPEEGEVLLGWYRTHLEGGLYLSPEEARFHESAFPEPWSLALVLAGSAGRMAGGVFQRTDPEGLSRSVYTPFYELVDPSSEFNGTTKRTFVGWANYQTESRVVRAGHGNVSDELPERARGTSSRTTRVGSRPASEGTVDPSRPEGSKPVGARPAEPANTGRAASGAAQPVVPPPSNGGGLPPEPVGPIGPITEPLRPAAASSRPQPTRATRPPVTGEVDSEAEWEKRQIQRTLMAVGRSLTPSELVSLGAPASDEALSPTVRGARGADAPSRPDGSGGGGARPGGGITGSDANAARPDPEPGPSVIPIRRDLDRDPGLVGRSRRRPRWPTGKILAAVAGLTLVATAGLVGTREMTRGNPTVGDTDGAGADAPAGSSVAGITLSPEELLRRQRNAGPVASEAAEGSSEVVGPESDTPTATADASAAAGASEGNPQPFATAEDVTLQSITPPAEGAAVDPGANRTTTPTRPAAESIAEAPSLSGLAVEDPAAAAYQNAWAIFRRESERYETVRLRFDDGLETCNPLNLSYRGVRDAYERLERRLSEAGERLPAPSLRAFDGAKRQFAMIRTHYMLTDCPMPVGG